MPPNNKGGNNQYGGKLVYPDRWPEILRKFRRQGLKRKEMIQELIDDHGFYIGERKLQDELTLHTTSVRRPSHTEQEAGTALVILASEDPHGRLGARALKERLASNDVQVSRAFVGDVLKLMDPDAVARRQPGAQKVHRHGLHSLGPNEEWSVDGHDKLVKTMGIGVWGVVDKYSRKVLGHFAVPNNRLADTVLGCFLLVVQRVGGVPIQVTADKGSETGKIHSLQDELRSFFAPQMDLEEVPAFVHLKSTRNITVERQWQPLFQKHLQPLIVPWLDHKGVYHSENELHQGVARFIWAKVVQNVLDRYAEEQANHKIRYQEESNLPTGGRPEQFYKHPERWAGVPCLIPVTPEVIADLVQQYVPENIFHFCPPDMHHAATSALLQLGNPTLMSDNAWDVFEAILPVVEGRLSTID